MNVCSDQLLAVFSTLQGCEQIIELATQGLGTDFADACGN